jgi:HD-GYP domain-containing protein (c-di-GMP phosphodiesterase class II)
MSTRLLDKEIEKSKLFYTHSLGIVKASLDEVRFTGNITISNMTKIVDEIITSITQHPTALLCMRGLQNSAEYTYHHSVNVALLSCIFAQFLEYSQEEIREIGLAGLLCGIGKQRIPLEILNAPRKLSALEFEIIKSHPIYAENLLKNTPNISENVIKAVTALHEKHDGTGYPKRLKGDEIHPYSVILSLADVYDALISERAYKKAFPQNKTAAMIYSQKDTCFKPDMVDLFICCFGVYPIGTLVKIDENKFAIVYENNRDDLLFPKVLEITKKEDKYVLASMDTLDLKQHKDTYKISICDDLKGENISLKELLNSTAI